MHVLLEADEKVFDKKDNEIKELQSAAGIDARTKRNFRKNVADLTAQLWAQDKSLAEKDSEINKRFSNIDVVVLPKCSEKEIQELERVLQIEKDVKQEYAWHAKALQFRETMQKEGLNHKQLQKRWGVSDIEHHIRGLEFAEEYLELRNWTDQYSRVDGDQYAFVTGISKELKTDENKIIGCTSKAWVICENNNNKIKISTDSESYIVRGLLHLLEKILSNRTKEEILSIEAGSILHNVGLGKNITSQRTNGFLSAVNKIQNQIKSL